MSEQEVGIGLRFGVRREDFVLAEAVEHFFVDPRDLTSIRHEEALNVAITVPLQIVVAQ